jgi:predicted RNA binding protein YcfA (HicA-like mRNA interferase family)
MPPKIRILEKQLMKADFLYFAGKGSHRNYIHPVGGIVVISGKPSREARPYQIKLVRDAILLAKNEN